MLNTESQTCCAQFASLGFPTDLIATCSGLGGYLLGHRPSKSPHGRLFQEPDYSNGAFSCLLLGRGTKTSVEKLWLSLQMPTPALDLGYEVGGLHLAHIFAKSDWILVELVVYLIFYP